MWFFNSPEIVFGEGAISYLAQIEGKRAFIVSDEHVEKLGLIKLVQEQLAEAHIECRVFTGVEPEPSLDTIRQGAKLLAEYEPDWIIGVGGGSPMDAAKAMWALYERPDLAPDGINPLEHLGLGKKARLITIPTTSGTGSECTWAIVLSDPVEKRKLGLGSRETLATLAIVDPVFAAKMPPRLTADTGLDALTHAIEGYTSNWQNDFSDGLCLQAVKLVFKNLQQAYAHPDDLAAREKMHNAAALGGLGFINSLTGLAHAMGHAFGAAFHVPHGRSVSLFLPYTMDFIVNGGNYRYADIARFIGLDAKPAKVKLAPEALSRALIRAVRDLETHLRSNTEVSSLGILRQDYESAMEIMLDHAENDTSIVPSPRVPDRTELQKIFDCAYMGKAVDF